jgi:hypothetical protein
LSLKGSYEIFAVALAAGAMVKEAGSQAGYSSRQAARLAKNPKIRERVEQIRWEASQRAVGSLAAGAEDAVKVLRELLADTQDASVRLQAAKAMLSHLVPIREHFELAERISKLEAQGLGANH